MKVHKKPTISIFTADTGHASMSSAIAATLSDKYTVFENNISGKYFNMYYPFYLYFPQLYKIPFALSQLKQANHLINSLVNKVYKAPVMEIFARQRPSVVISTWTIPNRIIETLQTEIGIPFINIIPDPRTFHILEPSAKAVNFVFDQNAAKRCERAHIPKNQIITAGWFVRSEYYQEYQQAKVRQQLGLDPTVPTILIAAGSEGTNWILKIIPAFIKSHQKLNVFFACGNNRQLYQLIKNMAEVNQTLRPTNQVSFIPLQYTNKLYVYLQAADLVVGKAGPNLLFETVATRTPFFAITHIAGQEDGNLDIIKEYKLGYVEENMLKANRLLETIINHPEKLKSFLPHLEKLARYNQQASTILSQTIEKLLTPTP